MSGFQVTSLYYLYFSDLNQIFNSNNLVIRYHMGTAACGSLFLALVNMMRIVLNYVKKKFTDPDVIFDSEIFLIILEPSPSLCSGLSLLLFEMP